MKSMHLRLPAALILVVFGMLITACTTGPNTDSADPEGTGVAPNRLHLTIQDWQFITEEMAADLIDSGVLETFPTQPTVIAIAKIENRTQQPIDVENFVRQIRKSLIQTGKIALLAEPMADSQIHEGSTDPRKGELPTSGDNAANRMPPCAILETTITQLITTAGSTSQAAYIFQFILIDPRDGRDLWASEKQVVKQVNAARISR